MCIEDIKIVHFEASPPVLEFINIIYIDVVVKGTVSQDFRQIECIVEKGSIITCVS